MMKGGNGQNIAIIVLAILVLVLAAGWLTYGLIERDRRKNHSKSPPLGPISPLPPYTPVEPVVPTPIMPPYM